MRIQVDRQFPATPTQQGMLYETLIDQHPFAGCGQLIYLVEGMLNPRRFREAWTHVVERHDGLRAAMLWEGLEEPQLRIVAPSRSCVLELDLTGLSTAQRRSRLQRAIEEQRTLRLDVTTPPLMRVTLVRLRDDYHVLIWCASHLALDGWSSQLVLRDVLAYHANLDLNRAFGPAPSVEPFLTWLKYKSYEREEKFWRTRLACPRGAPGRVLKTGTRENIPPEEFVTLSLDLQEQKNLEAFARSQRVTLNTVVQASWALTLAQATGQSNVVFAAAVAGRSMTLEGVHQVVGNFVNIVPLFFQIRPERALREWLIEIQSAMLAIADIDYCSLTQILKWSDERLHARDLESVLVFMNPYDVSKVLPPGPKISQLGYHTRTPFALGVNVTPGPAGMTIDVFAGAASALRQTRILGTQFARTLEKLANFDGATCGEACLHVAPQVACA